MDKIKINVVEFDEVVGGVTVYDNNSIAAITFDQTMMHYVTSTGYTGGTITLSGGNSGNMFYVLVECGADGYTFSGTNIKWTAAEEPIASQQGKIDIFSFLKIENYFYGSYAYNYSKGV
jgi:hypothetical protein